MLQCERLESGGIDSWQNLAGTPFILAMRLGLCAGWDFKLRERDARVRHGSELGGKVHQRGDWRTKFWMGGFDGDTMRGTLSVRLYARGASRESQDTIPLMTAQIGWLRPILRSSRRFHSLESTPRTIGGAQP